VKALLRVVAPGLLTTVQDLGRLHAIAGGVPPGGAVDRFAHQAANLLVGNPPGEATLECTLSGPELVVESPALVAITGADFGPMVNGSTMPMWTGVFLGAGDRVSFAGRRWGARAYIALEGGLEADRWLGSRSTLLLAGRGGVQGRALVAGDLITAASERTAPLVAGRRLEAVRTPDYSDHTLLAMPGPHFKRLDAASRQALFSETFEVSHEADRMGCRLAGPTLATAGEEVLSFGVVAGAVQVPHSGHPILLLADHQTAGGYPVVVTVVSASLPVAAQLAPGDRLRFKTVTAAQAGAGRRALNESLAGLAAR
jgi:antagonist of KipI